jgi:signal transduction histidine kinase
VGSAVVRVLGAPFTRRAWADLGYALISPPLALAGCLFTGAFFTHPLLLPLLPWSTFGVRRLAGASRYLARRLLGQDVPAPPPLRSDIDGTLWERMLSWLRDIPGWRARGYLMLKLPVSLLGVVAAGCTWLAGLWYLTYPVWWEIFRRIPITVDGVSADPGTAGAIHVLTLPGSFLLIPVGAALLLAAPCLTRCAVAVDGLAMRRLLGPPPLAERVRDLEVSRAQVVDDSAARLRSIERDLHDGTQAQLVGLAMKLGLAREKLSANTEALASAGMSADLDRAAELVDAAHRGAIEAIAELRTLVRGIHPPVLDNGLPDALTTLASRSAVPVELVTELPERPSAAIETIAYFCAAELLANVAKHSGARHAVVEAIHIPGLLRIRVSDDGHGGAHPDASGRGGLRGLADRIRAVDGRLDVSSPRGGPTVVTVELPSRA